MRTRARASASNKSETDTEEISETNPRHDRFVLSFVVFDGNDDAFWPELTLRQTKRVLSCEVFPNRLKCFFNATLRCHRYYRFPFIFADFSDNDDHDVASTRQQADHLEKSFAERERECMRVLECRVWAVTAIAAVATAVVATVAA